MMKKFFTLISAGSILFVILTLALIPVFSYAQTSQPCDTSFCNPLAVPTLSAFLDLALNALILILFPFVILFFIYGAFQLVTAQGNEKKISDAKKALLYTTIGALIVLGAKAITLAIKNTVNEIQSSVELEHPHPLTFDDDDHKA